MLPVKSASIAAGAITGIVLAVSTPTSYAADATRPAPSPVTRALFANHGDAFTPPQQNETLQSLLATHPKLDFYETCALGTAEQVSTMLRADPGLATAFSPVGWTPLHYAAFGGNQPVLALLLSKGASVNERGRNRFRNSPLAAAVLTRQIEAAKLLIAHGADVNTRQAGGFAPLQEAALLGDRELIDLLLASGAEINARANDGRNAVSEAERGKHPQIAAYLRERGGADAKVIADLGAEPRD